jgi:tRNA pseudouridine55 synthase
VEVEREAREIELFDLRLLASAADSLEFETLCSKGTYIRVLAEDIARALGTVGHVTMLRRVHVEPFESEPMETLESVIQAREQGGWPKVLPADWPLAHLPKVSLTGAQAARLIQGQAVSETGAAVGAAERVRLYDEAGRFLGIGATDDFGAVRPRRLFVQ